MKYLYRVKEVGLGGLGEGGRFVRVNSGDAVICSVKKKQVVSHLPGMTVSYGVVYRIVNSRGSGTISSSGMGK
jgi:hypothetical protein